MSDEGKNIKKSINHTQKIYNTFKPIHNIQGINNTFSSIGIAGAGKMLEQINIAQQNIFNSNPLTIFAKSYTETLNHYNNFFKITPIFKPLSNWNDILQFNNKLVQPFDFSSIVPNIAIKEISNLGLQIKNPYTLSKVIEENIKFLNVIFHSSYFHSPYIKILNSLTEEDIRIISYTINEVAKYKNLLQYNKKEPLNLPITILKDIIKKFKININIYKLGILKSILTLTLSLINEFNINFEEVNISFFNQYNYEIKSINEKNITNNYNIYIINNQVYCPDTCNTNTCNTNTCNTNTCNTDTCDTNTCDTDTCDTDTCNTNTCNTNTCNTDTCDTNTCDTDK